MAADVPRQATAARAPDRPGDASPFALGLLLRRAHRRAAMVMTEALRPLGIELRHFAVLIVLVDRGPTGQRAVRKSVPGDRRMRAVEITPQGVELFDAAHVPAEPLAQRLVAVLGHGEPEQLTDLITRFTCPADGEA